MGHEVIVPDANADEVRLLLGTAHGGEPEAGRRRRPGPTLRAAGHLLAVCAHLDGSSPIPALTPRVLSGDGPGGEPELDLRDVRGQVQAKRALTIAAAGGHSLLMRGPPGSGKSMLAMRLPGLLPPMTEAESLEVAAIASAERHRIQRQQLWSPTDANTASHGVCSVTRRWWICTAARRDQPGPSRSALPRRAVGIRSPCAGSLREPLEAGVVSISRASHHMQYPAQFQLVAAMNPCPCGRFGDPLGNCDLLARPDRAVHRAVFRVRCSNDSTSIWRCRG